MVVRCSSRAPVVQSRAAADAAAEAAFGVDADALFGSAWFGFAGGDEFEGVEGAGGGALAAAVALVGVDGGDMVRGDGTVVAVEEAEALEHFAAAGAAVAEEGRLVADVVDHLDEAELPGVGEGFEGAGLVDGLGEAGVDEVAGGLAEGEAVVEGEVAAVAQVFLDVAAVAEAFGPVAGAGDEFGGAFPVEDFGLVAVEEGFFLGEGSGEAGRSAVEHLEEGGWAGAPIGMRSSRRWRARSRGSMPSVCRMVFFGGTVAWGGSGPAIGGGGSGGGSGPGWGVVVSAGRGG